MIVNTKAQIVHSMCLIWNPDFNYIDDQCKDYVYKKMEQIYDKCIVPHMEFNCEIKTDSLEHAHQRIDNLWDYVYELEHNVEKIKQNSQSQVYGQTIKPANGNVPLSGIMTTGYMQTVDTSEQKKYIGLRFDDPEKRT